MKQCGLQMIERPSRSLELDENGEDIGDAIVPSRVMRRIPLRGPFSSKKGPFTWPVYEGFFTFFTQKGYKLRYRSF